MIYVRVEMYKFHEHTTNNVRGKRYRVYIRFFSNNRYSERERFRIFASDRMLFLHDMYLSRRGTMYRSVVDSTRNIAKSTNDIHVCEKNNGIRLFAECYAYARWKCKFVRNVCVCVSIHARTCMFAGDIFDKRMIWFKTRSAVIRKA